MDSSSNTSKPEAEGAPQVGAAPAARAQNPKPDDEDDATATPPVVVDRFSPAVLRSLRTWAAANNSLDDPYVAGLNSAITNGDSLAYWSTLDPTEALPRPVVPHGGLTRAAHFLAAVRNVMVFVPVAITWLAISRATDAFGEYTATLPEGSPVNFFDFWQNGGDGLLASEWRLGSVALVAFGLITAIVVLTLLSAMLAARGEHNLRVADEEAERERLGVALQIGGELHRRRGNDPEVISSEVASMIDDLIRAAERLEVASSQLSAATGNADDITDSIEGLSSRFTSESSNAAAQIAASVALFTAAAEGLSQSINQDAATSIRLVVAELEEVGDQLHKTSSSVELGTLQLREDLEAIHGRLSQLMSDRP